MSDSLPGGVPGESADDGDVPRGVEGSAVTVLHVDGDSEAVALAQRDPFASTSVGVVTAATAPEARERLSTGVVDCLVLEYDLPETTGVEFLETTPSADGVPAVLYSDRPLESFAREAVATDVTEYVRKGEPEQFEKLARSVPDAPVTRPGPEAGVGNGRVQAPPAVWSTLDDSGVYVRDWDLEHDEVHRYPVADGLLELRDVDAGPACEAVIRQIRPDHRKRVRSTVEDAIETAGSYSVEYALERSGSPVWTVERGRVLAEADTPQRLVALVEDVTERKRRERDLQRERTLNRMVRETLVESRTRSDLESTVLERLSGHGYDLVWLGDWSGADLQVRAVSGSELLADAFELEGTIDGGVDRPSVRAARTGDPQFVSEAFAPGFDDWDGTVRDWGPGYAAALPFVYRDLFYGVLTVYDDDPGRFEGAARRHLVGLGETLAAVVHDVETETELARDGSIRAKLQTVRPDSYLRDVFRAAEFGGGSVRITVRETIPHDDDRQIQYLSVDGAAVETVARAVGDHPAVEEVRVVEADRTKLQVVHGARTPEGTLATHGARVLSTSVTSDRTDILVEVPNRATLQSALDALEATNEHVSVLSCVERDGEHERDSSGPLADLTTRQLTVLQAAYHQGYFEQPRESSATTVADSLDISHPTLLEHLRRAQEKVFQSQFSRS